MLNTRFPDDQFDRYWGPFTDSNPTINGTRNISVSGFWNLPPSKVFDTALATDQLKPMELQWPPMSLPNSTYYIALYFANNHDSSTGTLRIFNVTIDGLPFYSNLNPSSSGVVVFTSRWTLSGLTKLTLTPASGSDLGPVINAGEIFDVLILGGRTVTRDGLFFFSLYISCSVLLFPNKILSDHKSPFLPAVISLERVKNSLQNTPLDWSGDPCLPHGYSWTGVTCSEGSLVRVVSL